jgi:hypothetical protein
MARPGLLAGTKANNIGTEILEHQNYQDGVPRYREWFRGDQINRAPSLADLTPVEAVRDHVLTGWMPDAPLIDRTTKITAFGSCFAANISSWLGQRNYRVSAKDENAQKAYVVRIGEGMVNSFVIRQQFEWAWEGKTFDQPLWHGYRAEDFGYDPEVQAQTRALFDETDVFVLTFGLSEVWYDEVTRNVFWRTVPKDVYDPARHKFRVSTVKENRDNITAIYRMIRKHRPDAKIILTLSPVPLIATFRDTSCISANAVSKSVLRVALDEVMRSYGPEGHLFYWPSYEIVMDVFGAPFMPDRRHLPKPVLDFIMMQFEEVWCKDEGDRASLTEAWILAQSWAGMMPQRMQGIVERKAAKPLELYHERTDLHPDPEVNAARAALLRRLSEEWAMQDAVAVAAE